MLLIFHFVIHVSSRITIELAHSAPAYKTNRQSLAHASLSLLGNLKFIVLDLCVRFRASYRGTSKYLILVIHQTNHHIFLLLSTNTYVR